MWKWQKAETEDIVSTTDKFYVVVTHVGLMESGKQTNKYLRVVTSVTVVEKLYTENTTEVISIMYV